MRITLRLIAATTLTAVGAMLCLQWAVLPRETVEIMWVDRQVMTNVPPPHNQYGKKTIYISAVMPVSSLNPLLIYRAELGRSSLFRVALVDRDGRNVVFPAGDHWRDGDTSIGIWEKKHVERFSEGARLVAEVLGPSPRAPATRFARSGVLEVLSIHLCEALTTPTLNQGTINGSQSTTEPSYRTWVIIISVVFSVFLLIKKC